MQLDKIYSDGRSTALLSIQLFILILCGKKNIQDSDSERSERFRRQGKRKIHPMITLNNENSEHFGRNFNEKTTSAHHSKPSDLATRGHHKFTLRINYFESVGCRGVANSATAQTIYGACFIFVTFFGGFIYLFFFPQTATRITQQRRRDQTTATEQNSNLSYDTKYT